MVVEGKIKVLIAPPPRFASSVEPVYHCLRKPTLQYGHYLIKPLILYNLPHWVWTHPAYYTASDACANGGME